MDMWRSRSATSSFVIYARQNGDSVHLFTLLQTLVNLLVLHRAKTLAQLVESRRISGTSIREKRRTESRLDTVNKLVRNLIRVLSDCAILQHIPIALLLSSSAHIVGRLFVPSHISSRNYVHCIIQILPICESQLEVGLLVNEIHQHSVHHECRTIVEALRDCRDDNGIRVNDVASCIHLGRSDTQRGKSKNQQECHGSYSILIPFQKQGLFLFSLGTQTRDGDDTDRVVQGELQEGCLRIHGYFVFPVVHPFHVYAAAGGEEEWERFVWMID